VAREALRHYLVERPAEAKSAQVAVATRAQ